MCLHVNGFIVSTPILKFVGMGSQNTNDNFAPLSKNLKWTPMQDDTLIQLMVEQCKEGRSIKGGFTCEGWNLLTKEMKTAHGAFFKRDKLKNRFKTLKKTYGDLKAMLDLSGFGWNDTRKMVIAEPDVWKEY